MIASTSGCWADHAMRVSVLDAHAPLVVAPGRDAEALPRLLMSDSVKLEVVGLAKRYGSAHALEPTSLEVRRGEFLTLLGPSGSGKTTLLMMIAGLIEPSEGRIRLDGADITDLPAYRRDIGVIFQNYALFPHLTVFENVAFPLRMRRRPEDEIRTAVHDTLRLVRLPHLAERLPRELSGGQQQRVAFARAIVFEPALVLMDEPLGALDKKLRDELKLEIRKLHKELGATVIYVTHDQDEAMLLSDRICLMDRARIVQIDSPPTLYRFPNSPFAADFIGESNLIPAEIAAGPDGQRGLRLPSGHFLATSHSDRFSTSGRVTVLLRPERLQFAPGSAGQNEFCGEAASVTDLGGTVSVLVKLAGGLQLKVVGLGGTPGLPKPGESLVIRVAPEDVVPLPNPEPEG
ncbi:putative spermidine/putrescine transport system ATP-binding protein [Rhizobiales bacterium GAS113]|nr:putative spermidine/putrescine transport system ATP-binding protein [Rhizobiales bacterium GAS113]